MAQVIPIAIMISEFPIYKFIPRPKYTADDTRVSLSKNTAYRVDIDFVHQPYGWPSSHPNWSISLLHRYCMRILALL